MIRSLVADRFESVLRRLLASGELPPVEIGPPEISDSKQESHGDYSCNVAMVLAKKVGMSPRDLAEKIAGEMASEPGIARCEVAGPGFLNVFLNASAVRDCLREILQSGESIAKGVAKQPLKINIEFVSVNPNGPITVGSGRGAAYGSTLCNVLETAGHTVHREYYINDGVNSEQMRLFTESVRALADGRPVPENGYKGDYVEDVAKATVKLFETGFENQIEYAQSRLTAHPSEAEYAIFQRHLEADQRLQKIIAEVGPNAAIQQCELNDLKLTCETLMSDKQGEDLKAFGVTFDTWFSEQSLHDRGQVDRDVQELIDKGVADTEPYRTQIKFGKGGKIEEVLREDQAKVTDESGANPAGQTLWLRSTKFGDDMDRVLRRGDGRLTYISADVAYHKDKFNRPPGTDKLMTILGPDHHGYISRLQAVVGALLESKVAESGGELEGQDALLYRSAAERDACQAALALAKQKLEVVIFQIVRFVKEGKPAPMRKRDGNIYALIDLITELGQNIAPNAPPDEQRRVGRDVARFFYLMRSHDTHMDFDIDLATKQSDENPVFYVQYAHARICSVIDKAGEAGLNASLDADLSALEHPKEFALIKKIADLPWEVQRCAEDYAVHRLTTYAVELARTYHSFYDVCRVIDMDNRALSEARVALCLAARFGLQGVFKVLGISAPVRMDRAVQS